MGANIGDSSLEIDSEQNIGSQGFVASKDDCINISLKVRPLSRRVQSAPRNLFNAKMNSKGQRWRERGNFRGTTDTVEYPRDVRGSLQSADPVSVRKRWFSSLQVERFRDTW